MKKQRWFWGIFFLLSAVLLVASQMGWVSARISFWSIIITLFLIAAFIQSLVHKTITGMIFSVAFLCMVYAEPLGIKHLVPWTILGAAFLVSVGLSLLFHAGTGWRIDRYRHRRATDKTEETTINDDSYTQLSGSMNSSIQYVQAQNFKRADIDVYAAGMKVYFDNTIIKEDNAEINITASFSGVEFYVPREWRIEDRVNSFLAGIEEKGRPSAEDGPTVLLKGNLKLSGLVIHYI